MVSVFVTDPSGDVRVLEPDDSAQVAGMERTRTELWASSSVRATGARFLPVLAERDLWVWPDEVDAFLAECETVSTRLPEVAAKTGYDPDYVRARLDNIIKACARAARLSGGVVVW